MVKISLLLASIILSGCSQSLHTVYLDRDVSVYHANEDGTKTQCQRAYSSWDGQLWTDYYGAPCLLFLSKPAEDIKSARPPYTRSGY